MMPNEPHPKAGPTFQEALRFWLKLGFISFGGPSGQIALMHTEVVEKRKWVSEEHFLHALNYCMLLPGPEAQQLATYLGWLLHGKRGGIAAGVLFVLPAAVLLWILSAIYVTWGSLPALAAVFEGLKPAVVAIVFLALFRIGRRALKTPLHGLLAAGAFAALFFFGLSFPLVVLGAGAVGLFGLRLFPSLLSPAGATPTEPSAQPASTRTELMASSLRTVVVCLALWAAPLVIIYWIQGTSSVLWQQGVFFSKAAMVTFGGAYAVLPYVGQQAVNQFGWLGPGQMLDGLALAETTPGPLIMVLQFVGFVGAWNQHGTLPPLLSATLGAFLTTWCTFVPCFLWILAGAPFIERTRQNPAFSAVLSAITASVVGVILNLAVWFGYHCLWSMKHLHLFNLFLTLGALAALGKLKWSMPRVIALCGLAGLARWAVL